MHNQAYFNHQFPSIYDRFATILYLVFTAVVFQPPSNKCQMLNVTSKANSTVRDVKFLRPAFCVQQSVLQYLSFAIQHSSFCGW